MANCWLAPSPIWIWNDPSGPSHGFVVSLGLLIGYWALHVTGIYTVNNG